MATRLETIRTERIKKIDLLCEKGIDPFSSKATKDYANEEIIENFGTYEGKEITLSGRIISWREHGEIVFGHIQDESGKIQLFIKKELMDFETNPIDQTIGFSDLSLFDIGDFIQATGVVIKTVRGEISLETRKLKILTKSVRPLPSEFFGLKDIEERYRKRYLDMILNPDLKKRLINRSRVIAALKNYLDSRDFIEVETPTMQPIYGGGFAKPFVTHHNALDSDFYLRISDEMYLKRMIVGGFEKIYEITKVFRNEGIDFDHNPEFTMFEAMVAYQDYQYGMDLIEELIEHIALTVFDTTEFEYQGATISLKRPWTRYKLVDAIKEIGGVDTSLWKSVEQAEKELSLTHINKDKLKEIKKMRSIGEIIAFAFEELVEERLIQPTIIYDYPVEISPLAKKAENPKFTQRFEMFAFGSELGNNYTELTDPVDLKTRFIEEKKREKAGFDEAHQIDYDYLVAIEHGFPPTVGMAIGIDRLVMLLTNSISIREVIAFPTLRPIEADKTLKSEIETKNIKSSSKTKDNFTRDDALILVNDWTKNPNLVKHMLCVEAEMRALAKHFGEDEELWGLAGLLHDADYEMFKEDTKKHPSKIFEELEKRNVDKRVIDAIRAHAYGWNENAKEPENNMEWSIFTCDEISGFIVACALVTPEKKLAAVTLERMKKKWREKSFAAGVKRQDAEMCDEKLGIKLDDYMQICLTAIQGIAPELGL